MLDEIMANAQRRLSPRLFGSAAKLAGADAPALTGAASTASAASQLPSYVVGVAGGGKAPSWISVPRLSDVLQASMT